MSEIIMTRRDAVRGGVAALGALAAAAASGCGAKEGDEAPASAQEATSAAEVEALAGVAGPIGAWSVYWDCDGDVDLVEAHATSLESVCLFEAYFVDGALTVPDETSSTLRRIRRRLGDACPKMLLSVVNDVEKGGETTQKDTEVLRGLLADDASARDHAREVVALAEGEGFDGIEIDYEKIRGDMGLWGLFLGFERQLIELAGEAGLSVRVALEPSTPAGDLEFPEGAEHVVMCYNLCGGGTEPGPKADKDFLRQMAQKFGGLPGVAFALANGGYVWDEGTTSAKQATSEDLAARAADAGSSPARDEGSGALSFSYADGGAKKVAWYADAETLAGWARELADALGSTPKIRLWHL